MELVIIEIIQEGVSTDKEVTWLKCRTSNDKIIAFWGELNRPNRNIIALRNQTLPIHIEILNPDMCEPTTHEINKYGLALIVPPDAFIQINPEY